jgi:hypothetical protein
VRRTYPLLVALLVLAAQAHAHDADVVYASLSGGAGGQLVETITLTGNTLALLAPVDADHAGNLTQAELLQSEGALKAGVWDEATLSANGVACARAQEFAGLREGYVELQATFTCGEGELKQDFRFLRVLPTNYRVVLGSQVEGEQGRAFAQGSLTTIRVPRPGVRALAPEGLPAQLLEGAREALRLDALAVVIGLFLLWGSARRESPAPWFGFAIAALLGGLVSVPATPRSVVLVASLAFALWQRSREWALVGAILLAGLASLPEPSLGMAGASFGVNFGTTSLLLTVGVLAMLASRRLDARPAVRVRLALGALAAALFGLGFRLSGWLAS